MPNKSIIFFSTQTSATGSMRRIYYQLFIKYYKSMKLKRDTDVIKFFHDNTEGACIFFNRVPTFSRDINLSDYRFIINYRDPRDRVCNQFHWGKVHPLADGSTDHLPAAVKRLNEMGIDQWVLKNTQVGYYDNLLWLLENLDEKQYIVQSYAKLCLDFDKFVEDATQFIGNTDISPKMKALIELNRVENLNNNPAWIGNEWVEGSDTAPGRYKRELQPETIKQLNKTYHNILNIMAKYDPEYADTYS